jgi:hypothetical protein
MRNLASSGMLVAALLVMPVLVLDEHHVTTVG